MHRILVATDFSDASQCAVSQATELTMRAGSRLTLCHVHKPVSFGPPTMSARASWSGRDSAERFENAAREQLDVERRCVTAECDVDVRLIRHAHVGAAICELARQERPDLIVVGSHGAPAMRHFLIGSTTEHVVRYACAPVLVARSTRTGGFPRRTIVCTDLSAGAASALIAGKELRRLVSADVALVHVASKGVRTLEPHTAEIVRGELREQLLVLSSASLGGSPQVRVLDGDNPSSAILTHASGSATELIVVATHGRSGLERLLIGSVAERVTRHATCSVLVTRAA